MKRTFMNPLLYTNPHINFEFNPGGGDGWDDEVSVEDPVPTNPAQETNIAWDNVVNQD